MPLHSFIDGYAGQFEHRGQDEAEETEEQKENREKFALMGEALAWVLEYCWLGPGSVTREARAAFKRFVAVSMTVRPDLFDGGAMSFARMARKLRFTEAALSHQSVEFAAKVGLHFRRNRRDEVRRAFSKVQKRVWAERKAASNGHVNGAPHKNGKP